ncbi:MAG TPA: hypothetical protein VF384_06490 [Planctomycetota bacterium]
MRFLLAALVAAVASAQTTWIVDDTPGPGVHFTSLPAAVAAAASGDALLVAPGNYEPFHVNGKALSILGDGHATTVIDGSPIVGASIDYVVITAPPAGTTFRLSGVAIRRDLPPPAAVFTNRLAVLGAGVSTAGTVVLTDVITEPATTTGVSGGNGLAVTGIAVHASRCVFRAGWWDLGNGSGASGVVVNGAGLFVADACVLSGGSSFIQSFFIVYAFGGDGLHVLGSTAHLTRTNLVGGSGLSSSLYSMTGGGAGLRAVGNSSVRVYGSAANAISGGDAGYSSFGTGGAGIETVSPATVSVSGAIAISGGSGSAIAAPSTAGTGQILLGLPPRPALTLAGAAPTGGDLQATQPVTLVLDAPTVASQLFVLFADLGPGFFALPGLTAEPFLLTGSAILWTAGLLDAAGQFSTTFVPATQLPGLVNLPLHLQAFAVDPALGIWLGSNAELRRIR